MRRVSQRAKRVGCDAGARQPVVLRVDGPLSAGVVDALCAELQAVMRATDVDQDRCEVGVERAIEVAVEVGPTVDADARTLDALARLQLTARRLGGSIRLHTAPRAVLELIAFAGLNDVVPRVCG